MILGLKGLSDKIRSVRSVVIFFLCMCVFSRNSGMGLVSVASRIGAASSPFVVQTTRVSPILPFALMGILSFIAAVLCWVLPETLGKKTAEVFGDNEDERGK